MKTIYQLDFLHVTKIRNKKWAISAGIALLLILFCWPSLKRCFHGKKNPKKSINAAILPLIQALQ